MRIQKLILGFVLVLMLIVTGCDDPELFSVTYENGSAEATGTVADSNLYLEGNAVPVLSGHALSRTGYVFVGWQELSDRAKVADQSRSITLYDTEGNPLFNEGSSFNMPGSDVVLEAQWDPEAGNTITYNLDDGVNSVVNPTSYYRNDGSINLYNPTKPGFIFLGWFTEEIEGTQVTSINSADGDDVVLFARWDQDTQHSFDVPLYVATDELHDEYEIFGYIHAEFGEEYTVPSYAADAAPAGHTVPFGYSNGGWWTRMGSTGGIRIYGVDDADPTVVTAETVYDYGNHTLYLRWTAKDYLVTFHANGGTGADYTQTIAFDSTEALDPVTFTKAGYDFDGWAVTAGEPGFYDDEQNYLMETEGDDLYATWTLIEYDITYNLNAGTNNVGNPDDFTAETPTITLLDPTKNGYDFDGWYEEATFLTPVEEITLGSSEDVTLYAKWTPVIYDITYNLDGGTNNGSNPATYTIETATITLGDPTKNGYDFGGWYSEDTFTNVVTTITLGSTGDVDLFAEWTLEDDYDITYDLDNGTNNVNNPATYNIETPTIILEAPTRNGYDFGGWYSEDTFTNVVTTITVGSTGDVDLFAKWTPTVYNITYELDGGTNHGSNPATYNIETATITLGNPTKTGYTFEGWYEEDTFVNEVTSIVLGSTGDVTVYADWTPLEVVVTFDVKRNGNQDPDDLLAGYYEQTLYYDAVIVNFPGATHDNSDYEFSYWIDDDNKVWEIDDILNDDRFAGLSTDLALTLEAVYSLKL